MKRIFVIIGILYIVITSLQAQVITWSVKPGDYDNITPCWGDMFFVYKDKNMGVINGDGKVIVPTEASSITEFYSGLALVLKNDGGQERILGILSTDGSYSAIDGTYFTIPYQKFFSEGLLTVTTPRGQAGYMNGNGVIVKSFDVSFISPFSEGYAVVGENEDFSIIDKRFNVINIQLGTVSQVYGGSNVYKGVAVVWDGNGKFYNFDVKRGTSKKISEPSSLDYDYLYCFSCITNRPESVQYEKVQRPSETLVATKQGGKYGYLNGDKIVLPCQFEDAESFHGNYAIVKVDKKYALLSLQNTEDTFIAKANSDIKYKRSSSKNLVHRFGINFPNIWGEDKVNVRVKDDNGIPVNISNNGGSYEFKADGANGIKKYFVEIEGEGIKLWNGEIAYNYTIEPDPVPVPDPKLYPNYKNLTVRLDKGNTHANDKNLCSVKAYITNPNPADITTKVTWTGSNLLEGSNTTVTVPANGSKLVTIYLKVLKAQSGQSVTVKVSAGGSATLDNLQLIPF